MTLGAKVRVGGYLLVWLVLAVGPRVGAATRQGMAAEAARAWEGEIVIPTYGWEEDINPKFWALEGQVRLSTTVKRTIVYPYTMQDHLSRKRQDRTYKALFLENEYLKVTCLPELGGRLHSVIDKTTGEEVFHANRVIKPSMIAMRGAFISGGVEWNAGPQVHTVTIVSPVDAVVGTDADGSAWLQVSNIEKSLRTHWTVRLTLRPGRAYLDEAIRIENPVDAVNPYYFWNCTAFPCRKGTRFIYPMTLGTDHYAREFFDWPVHEGRDLSWLKNYETWASIFAVDCTFDFFGAYDVDADRGVVQVADRHELSGKKAWTWGQWDFGLVSQQNLTDEDGPYIEVQSGPLPTQSDYGMLLPRQAVSWREWWYPVHGLGDGFEYATRDVAVQRVETDGGVQLRMIATAELRDAVCTARRGGKVLLKKSLDLTPAKAAIVNLPGGGEGPVEVMVRGKDGAVLAAFTTPLPIPQARRPVRPSFEGKENESLTVEELFLKGRQCDLATDRAGARRCYEMALARDAGYSAALRNLGVLDYEAGLYDRAAERLCQAVGRDATDGVAWYFLGLSRLRAGRMEEALECAYRAVRCLGAESLGYDLAGRVLMRRGECRRAMEAFERARAANPSDDCVANHRLLALYALGDRSALEAARRRIEEDPTDIVPRAVIALLGKVRMGRFVEEVRAFVGEDDFEMIEAALVLANLGLFKDAAAILDAVCVKAVQAEGRSPLPLYYIAYFRARAGDETGAQSALKEAAGTWQDGVFASRPEGVAVLRYAIAHNPEDAHAHLHLGNLYAHLGRLDEATECWREAARLDSGLSIAWRNLGLLAWSEEDLAEAAALYRKAIAARPGDQTLYRDLADVLIADKKRAEAIRLLEEMPVEGMRRADIIIMLAQAYVDEKRYDAAIELLEGTPYFVNWEGQTITWDLFNRAHMERGKARFEAGEFAAALADFEAALTYPENIGVGRSNKPREAPAQYRRGRALESLGRKDEARAAWKLGADGIESSQEQNRHIQLCREALEGKL